MKKTPLPTGPLPPTGPENRTVQGDERLRVDPDGVILGHTRWEPAVFALSGIDFTQPPTLGHSSNLLSTENAWPEFHVFALTSKRGCKRGDRYLVTAVTAKGELRLMGLAGFHPMGDFVQALRMPYQPANDNASSPTTAT